MTELNDLIDFDDLSPEERERLQRVHELLLEAGPPVELPPELHKPFGAPEAEVVAFPLLPQRRVGAAVLLAAAVVAAAFVGGFVLGHSKGKPASLAVARVVNMHGSRNALAVLTVARPDSVGNWPMVMNVTGLPKQPQRAAYYELWLTQKNGPKLPCGTFRVNAHTTTIRLTVPYSLSHASGWVVTRQEPGGPEPGPVVLTT